jgi:5-formaminoimidazole-4-carboxamide-1-beta-D-ribofuranosyl 5'-monophosphate synthetase
MLDLIKKVFNINGTSDTNLLNGLQVMGTHHIMSGISNINIIIKSKSGFTISGIANAEISSKTIIIPRVLKISNTPNSLTKITLTKAELEKPKPTDTFEDISDLIMFKINKTLSLNKISDTPTLEFYSTRKLL